VDKLLHRRSLTFRNANQAVMALDLAAGDEGVAFRYRFPAKTETVRVVQSELTGFQVETNAQGWLQPYHAASEYTPAYEDFFFKVAPGTPPPRSRGQPKGWAFPALFQFPRAGWALLTETGTDSAYCACHLDANSDRGRYRMAFPEPDERTKGRTNGVGPEPRHTLPWTMPWRVMVLGATAGDIATATLVTDLAEPSRIPDTSWIHPGRASWAWWGYPDGPHPASRFNAYSDLAARMGWEFTLFDAGWWEPGLTNIASHALAAGVMPLAWAHAADYYTPEKRQRNLDRMQRAGVKGVKVDFWCSDRQETMTAIQSLFEDAAARRLVVNLHGCTLPRGWQRTWPNFLTAEAVLGYESYFYESHYTEKAAELNTILPFTRNAVGPMDITPLGCSPKKYPRLTTAAHELAAALIFTSGIIHYADKPEFIESLPKEAQQILRDAPVRWEETRCLVGEPGRMAVFAKRTGKSWFIAGINGTGETWPARLDLRAFKEFTRRLTITEGDNANLQVRATTGNTGDQWVHAIPPRGGFVLRLDR
jgi:hypothetical protein